jgi:4-alpha-glucanotransferase
MRFAGVLRIDHVMGLMRAFWAPENGVPGSYVAMPIDALLAVIRIEASRTGTVVIGEDLGLVPDGLRDALHRSGLLSMRLMMFDDMHPGDYPADTLAGFATHDLPTWAGWRQARDVAIRQELGIIDADAARAMQTDRAHQVRRLDGMIGGDTANAMHSALGQAGSALVAVQAVDALGLLDQANLPGTVDGYPNWRQRLPVDATGLARHPGMVETARILNHARPKEA